MTATISPPMFLQFLNPNNTGSPANGFKLFTYAANSSTKQATWTDSTQSTQNANPLLLDSNGVASGSASSGIWGDPTLLYKFVWAPANDTDPPSSPIRTIDNISFPVNVTLLTQNFIGLLLYPRTAAEIAAGVTPVNYAYAELYLERYGGGTAVSAATNNTALSAAISVATQKGGGTISALASGTYSFSSTFTLPTRTTLAGGGKSITIFSYSGSGSFLTLDHNFGRGGIRDLQIQGTSQTGTGITLGDATANATFVHLQRLLITQFDVGLRMGGATWFIAEECEFGNPASSSLGVITNNVGMDFNYFSTNNYSSGLIFKDIVVSNNANAGVQATSVTVTMNEVSWINCNVQNNCQSATGNPQFYMGLVVGFTIDNMYMEYVLGGTAPDALRADNLGAGQIRSIYINTAATGIKDRSGGSMNQVEILSPRIFGIVTKAIDCASETDVIVRNASIGGGVTTVTLTGTGCRYLASGAALASWPTDEGSFSPAIAFGTSGSITQTVQGATYSQIGNVVFFSFRINWSAISSPTGNVTVTGLPIAAKSGGPDVSCSVFSIGIIIASGYLEGFIQNGQTIIQLYNVQTSTVALQGSAFASSGSVLITGSYQV